MSPIVIAAGWLIAAGHPAPRSAAPMALGASFLPIPIIITEPALGYGG